MNNLEVELRGTVSKQDFLRVEALLKKRSEPIEDNKLTYFFVTKGFILKVTDEKSNNLAKITIKAGDETNNILREYEIEIPKASIHDSVLMFKELGFSNVNPVEQIRTNYKYKGAEISLKYTNDWGLHFEAEISATNEKDARKAKKVLSLICKELGLVPMNPQQIRKKIERINKSHGFI